MEAAATRRTYRLKPINLLCSPEQSITIGSHQSGIDSPTPFRGSQSLLVNSLLLTIALVVTLNCIHTSGQAKFPPVCFAGCSSVPVSAKRHCQATTPPAPASAPSPLRRPTIPVFKEDSARRNRGPAQRPGWIRAFKEGSSWARASAVYPREAAQTPAFGRGPCQPSSRQSPVC